MIETLVVTEVVTDATTDTVAVVELAPVLVAVDVVSVVVVTEHAPEVIEVSAP